MSKQSERRRKAQAEDLTASQGDGGAEAAREKSIRDRLSCLDRTILKLEGCRALCETMQRKFVEYEAENRILRERLSGKVTLISLLKKWMYVIIARKTQR